MLRFANEMDLAGMPRLADAVTSAMERLARARVPWSQLLNFQGPQAVSRWQTFLNGTGAKLQVDGIFGPATKQATMQFQKSKGVLVDGLVGPQTLAAAGLNAQGSPSGSQVPKTTSPAGGNRTQARPSQAPAPTGSQAPPTQAPRPNTNPTQTGMQARPAGPPQTPGGQPTKAKPAAQQTPAPTAAPIVAKVKTSMSGPQNQANYLGNVASAADDNQIGPIVERYYNSAMELVKRFNSLTGELEQYAGQVRDQKQVETALAPVRQAIQAFRSARESSFNDKVGGITRMFSAGRMGERLEAVEQAFRRAEQTMVDIVGIANLG